jgi:adenine-specific DNA-methyltransferase
MRHLDKYQPDLEKRYSYQRVLPFWEWAFKRSEQFFLNGHEKGFVPCKERLTSRSEARFVVASPGVVATQDVTAFSPKNGVREQVPYLVAYLAQPIVTEWIRLRGLMKGGVAEFSERPLANIPFRSRDWNNPTEVATHQKIVDLVRRHATSSPSARKKIEEAIKKEFAKLLA